MFITSASEEIIGSEVQHKTPKPKQATEAHQLEQTVTARLASGNTSVKTKQH